MFPVVAAYRPARQSGQVMAPVMFDAVPISHGSQPDCPSFTL